MNPEWKNLADLAEDLRLSSNSFQPGEMRTELRRRLAELHPDKSGGQFASEEKRDEFDRTRRAIEFLDSIGQPGLVPISEISALIKTVVDAVAPAASRDEVADKMTQFVSRYRREASEKSFPRKLGSGVFAAAAPGFSRLKAL